MKQINLCSLRRIFALILSLALCAVFAGCDKNTRKTKEMEAPVLGIDVARYQGTLDWQKLGDSGIGFAFVRLGYRGLSTGEITEDNKARYNLQEGSKAGIPMGAYFYSTAVSVEEAREEARWAAELIAKYPITYPVVFDYEGFRDENARHFQLTNADRTEIALAFLKTIEDLGYEGMFYGAKNEIDAFFDIAPIEKDYKIWIAQYPAEPYPATPASSYEGVHHMWQYTAEGRVLGIDSSVDLNIAYFAYDGIEPPKDPIPAEEVGPDVEARMTFAEVDEQVTAKEATNLRNIPSQDADAQVMDTLYNGEYAHRIAVSADGWSKVVFEGNTYYALTNYLTTGEEEKQSLTPQEDPDGDGIKTQFTPVSTLVTAKDVVNLRALPSATREDATVLFQLKKGEVATCVGVSDNGWSKLEYMGTTCYAVSSYLTEALASDIAAQAGETDVGMEFKEISDKVTARKAEVNLRTHPTTDNSKSSVVVKLKNGEVVARTGINKTMGWSRVVYYGRVLYCSSSLLTEVVN